MAKKKETTNKSKTEKEGLYILSDLINESEKDPAVLMGCLVEADLYEQYQQEMEYKRYNKPVEPTITQKEFDKLTKLLGV